ncbi:MULTISPECIES: hypothetical protein [Streptomyces]|uniref:Tat pathway signal sequence domain protein n=1 Tax=Streptomyces ramulosus TaxID=47762 RepID=A0ABW1FD77_9ACTN
MKTTDHFSRRRLLGLGAATAAGGVLLASGLTTPAQAAAAAKPQRSRRWNKSITQNGWPVLEKAALHHIEGSNLTVRLADGDAATILLYVAQRYLYEVDAEVPGNEITGHTTERTVTTAFESNSLSGTALTIRPLHYPVGAKDGFFPQQQLVIRDILADLEGVVRWGSDLKPVKESHFQLDVPPGDTRMKKVAAKLTRWDHMAGQGAGSIDAFTPQRRQAARKLEAQQQA